MSRVLERKSRILEETRLKLNIGPGREIEVRKCFDKAVNAVLLVNDVVSPALSSEPHAAIAWAGICVLLPVCIRFVAMLYMILLIVTQFLVNSTQQRDADVQGIATITVIICRSKVVGSVYAETTVVTPEL